MLKEFNANSDYLNFSPNNKNQLITHFIQVKTALKR